MYWHLAYIYLPRERDLNSACYRYWLLQLFVTIEGWRNAKPLKHFIQCGSKKSFRSFTCYITGIYWYILKKSMIELKSFKKWSMCRQAQLCWSNGLKVTEVWSWWPKNLLGKKTNFGNKKIKLLVCQCFTSKQWEKHSKIHDHFEALRKTFQMRPCWMSLLYPFRNGVRMKTGGK